jgi:flavin reductase (DIM6/NTAB) family NADH-FMN oxidoreductase RutF
VDEAAKKQLLRAIPHGVYVVTSGAGAEAYGFTATWLTQTSFKPPMVALAVKRESHAYGVITKNRTLAVNFVPKDGMKIAERFFQAPRPENGRFGELEFTAAPTTGAPVLAAAAGYVECKVVDVVDRGDHSVMVCEVVGAARLREGETLVLADTPWKYGG